MVLSQYEPNVHVYGLLKNHYNCTTNMGGVSFDFMEGGGEGAKGKQ